MPSADAKPNIVFIMADDLGYADLSCFGRRDFETPRLDRLARGGQRLTQAYANSSVCSATRLALITGRYQYRLRAGLEEPISGRSRGSDILGLPPSHPTLPSLLRAAGYATTLVGKWHMGYPPHFGPLRSGYDHFYGVLGGGVDYFTHKDGPLFDNPGELDLFDEDVPIEQHGYLTDLLATRANEAIAGLAAAGTPFFLSLHFTSPHWPWEGPEDEEASRTLKSLIHFDGGTRETYAAMVRNLDHNVGRVLDALDAAGLAENTIVIFTSDNGGERFSDVWPFVGTKAELLEGGLRVPTILRWPGRIAPGVSDQVMISMDWCPTLLAAAGGVADPQFPPDGENLLPVLSGADAPHSRTLYWRYKSWRQRALRDGDWKYLSMNGNEFLIDVARDPRERANLKDRHPDIFARLKADYAAWEATMLPELAEASSYGNSGALYADRYGAMPQRG